MVLDCRGSGLKQGEQRGGGTFNSWSELSNGGSGSGVGVAGGWQVGKRSEGNGHGRDMEGGKASSQGCRGSGAWASKDGP